MMMVNVQDKIISKTFKDDKKMRIDHESDVVSNLLFKLTSIILVRYLLSVLNEFLNGFFVFVRLSF